MHWILFFSGLILDQASKLIVAKTLPYQETVTVIPWLIDFFYVKNSGASFSILQGKTVFLIIFSAISLLAIFYIIFRLPKEQKLLRCAFSVLAAGALGNLVDRIRVNAVIDFIKLHFFPAFPIFNIADCLIVCSIAVIAWQVLWPHKGEGAL
ncbi:MAG: signal peptidase II [Clostridiales bacterium]|nr:signal peptidase II [Clostridiales bacterium]